MARATRQFFTEYLWRKKGSAGSSKAPDAAGKSEGLSELILEADFELVNGLVDGMNGIDAVAAEVVIRMLEVVLGVMQRPDRIFDFRMRAGSRGWFCGWSRCRSGGGGRGAIIRSGRSCRGESE
jgi:hypothetical protein